jgi:hypothetical protein
MTRTPWLWPFGVDSFWNLPVATTAQYEAASAAKTAALLGGGGVPWMNCEQYSHPVYAATEADPVAVVTDTNWSARNGRYYVPATATPAAGTDAHLHVMAPDGRFCQEAWAVARQSSTALTCGRHEISDLHGSGGGPTGGTRAYGGSALGGLIRTWEIQAGEIRHALAVSLANDQLYSASNNTGWVWPATEQDANAAWTYTGSIPMGSYFAIPPGVDVEALSLDGSR